jgi:hypothetical protein
VKAAADVSVTYAYGIVDEARRHIDIIVSKQASRKKAEPGELGYGITTVGLLFTRAYKKWGIYRAQVLKALGVKEPSEILDLDGAWKTLENMAEKEKFGGQAE